MILLIDAGGMRSSAPLSSNTVPVSTSSRSACFACVSIPIPGLLGGSSTALAVFAFGLGLAASVGQPGTPATSTAAAIRDPAKRNSRRILISRLPYFAGVNRRRAALLTPTARLHLLGEWWQFDDDRERLQGGDWRDWARPLLSSSGT